MAQSSDISIHGSANAGSPSIGGAAKRTVLIIDDDSWINRLLSKYLVSYGFNPISSTDPFEGIGMAVKEKPDLVFLDVLMPDLNGDKVLRVLRSIDETADIPILILSANLNKEIIKLLMNGKASGFVSKPFTHEVVIEKIKEVCSPSVLNSLNLEMPQAR